MEIEFNSPKLQKLCEDNRYAKRELGQSCAKKLQTRIADIFAAQSVFHLPTGKPHQLKGDHKGEFALELSDGKRLVIIPANNPTPLNEDGNTDWSLVTKVRIIYIGDYHD